MTDFYPDIAHDDLQSPNVLLDKDYNAKISDTGSPEAWPKRLAEHCTFDVDASLTTQ